MDLRSRAFTAMVMALAIGVAACGGSSTGQMPTDEPAATDEPMDTSEAPPEPGATSASGAIDFTEAATKLAELDSYKYSVTVLSNTTTSSGPKAHTMIYTGTVNKKDGSQYIDMVEKDGTGTITVHTTYVILPTAGYTKDLNGTWETIPAEMVSAYASVFENWRPEQMFSYYWGPGTTENTTVGTETKNGVSCTHIKAVDSTGLLSGVAGVSGTWSSDVWLAVDGGYLVHSEASVASTTGTDSASFSAVIDITDINGSNNTVTAPI